MNTNIFGQKFICYDELDPNAFITGSLESYYNFNYSYISYEVRYCTNTTKKTCASQDEIDEWMYDKYLSTQSFKKIPNFKEVSDPDKRYT